MKDADDEDEEDDEGESQENKESREAKTSRAAPKANLTLTQKQQQMPLVLGNSARSAILLNLDEDDANVMLSVVTLTEASASHKRESLHWLHPLLRLMATTEKLKCGGSMENLDACLGCPLLLYEEKLFDHFDTWGLQRPQQERVCMALFHSINW